jgi:diaminohydroxyphosphoribosylaminopyrimidine deaminase/5-amino-6-(5-phosphoribosylamino)uracil reductase
MRRALELARLGKSQVPPNPMVGCVVVHDNKIIGEGWHQQYGGAHAEVNALNAVADKALLPGSRVYVTLEPCSHYGKTPPCADFLIHNNVRDVVICNTDPNPVVKGAGIRKLLQAGCQVHTGLLEPEGQELNKYFFTFHEQQRPYITLKWAETADGFIGSATGERVWISNALSRRLVHKWRTEQQAIMVGSRTALLDNPQLNSRDWTGPDPVRIVLNKNLSLPHHLHFFDHRQPTLVYNFIKTETEPNLEFICLDPEAAILPTILADLYQRNIQSVLIEGGANLLSQFINNELWDEAFVFKSSHRLLDGIPAPRLPLGQLRKSTAVGTDTLFVYHPK